ncbi:MAG: type II toxin-antitoxin system VapC family toxin [Planctomycetia bacterium]
MRILLDSHAFLWFILGDQRLSDRARSAIATADTDVLVSPATLWEMAIKVRLGKYALPEPFGPFMESQLAANRFRLLPIEVRHAAILASMPFHHRDPFDRLIVAQALAESIAVVSVDAVFDLYGVARLW